MSVLFWIVLKLVIKYEYYNFMQLYKYRYFVNKKGIYMLVFNYLQYLILNAS
jgi:hypothetical protein